MAAAVLLVFALLSGALATVPLSAVQRTTSSRLVPGRFIVELNDLASLSGKRSPSAARDEFYSALDKRSDEGFKVDHQFDSSVFVGAVVSTPPESQNITLAQLAGMPGVKSVRPVLRIPRPEPVAKIIPNGPRDPSVPKDSQSTHVMTGVDKLHARGLYGKGIKIGIIDTGTDYKNPALGGAFGPGNKVAGGYDFVGDAFDGTNVPVPDSDPLDQCAGHGTHVAGIIGANPGNAFNISGVAYESTIFSYRVFGCEGSVTDDILVEALLRGQSDGMDILTLSIGGPDGWTESVSSVVASRLADSGKIVTIAAGNEGSFGSWYTSSPGNGINVISVASVENTFIPVQNATTSDPVHPTIPYFSLTPLPINGSLPIYATSNDTSIVDDACNPLPDSTPDLSKFLVIVRRGSCTFVTKLQNIAAKGAKASLIYDNGNGFTSISTLNFTTAFIQASDGQFLVGKFVAGATITVSFPQTGGSFDAPNPLGGLVSTFSTYGPTNDLFFKPAIAAPGGNILSTFPVTLGSFAVLSGTSMATPFVAGCSALLLQSKGKSLAVARGARTLFETTAQSIPSSNAEGVPLQTLTQQGAGLINAFYALDYKTSVSPGEINLNDTTHFDGSHTITVKNNGSTRRKYKITHVPAGTAVTIRAGTIFPSDGPVPLITDFATVRFSTKDLKIPPHGTATFRVNFKPPANVDKTTFPVYSGFVQIQSTTDGEILHVAYQGVAAAVKDMTVLDNTDTYFGPGATLPTVLDSTGNVQQNATNYTFTGDDFPTIVYRLASGTPRLLFDLVSPNITLSKRSLEERALPSDWTPRSHGGGGSFSRVPIVGPLVEYDYQSRSSDAETQDEGGFSALPFNVATFANNTRIPDGQYRVLVRGLRKTGDPKKEEDYETYLSPIIGVNGGSS